MTERALLKPQIIAELTKSPHGKLAEYLPVGQRAAIEDPDFFAHLVAWNAVRGQVRDAQVALPVIALASLNGVAMPGGEAANFLEPYIENALAHLAAMDPRAFVKALDFAKDIKAPSRVLRRLVTRYLREKETIFAKWEGTALQHRASLKTLYSRFHVNTNPAGPKGEGVVNASLYKGTAGGRFGILKQLASMSPEEAAGTIVAQKIPFLVARGALGAKAKDPDVVLALIAKMSPTELVTNMKWLERLGVKTNPALRAALEAALGAAATAKTPRATLKTTRAAEIMEDAGDTQLGAKLRGLQERQLDKLGSIEGRWLVLGDKSGSMTHAIETARSVAAVLARMVKGQVHLVFFDTSPRYLDATGQSYEDLKRLTAGIAAGGGTSIGCGLRYALDKKLEVDGIAIVSDGGHNTVPAFASTYQAYCAAMGVDPTVYFYETDGEPDAFSGECARAGIDVQTFPLRGTKVDYYSLPNLVSTMRVGRYQLLDEVLATPLKTLDMVLPRTMQLAVLPKPQTAKV